MVVYNCYISISIVGNIPAGIILTVPGFHFSINFQSIVKLFPVSGLTFAIISYAGNYWTVAKKFPAVDYYSLDPTQELLTYGFSNILGVYFHSFIASAGLSRSAVNAENGTRTPLSGCISSIFMTITLLCATSIFYYIPKATLAAIVLISVYPMTNFPEFYRVYKLISGIVLLLNRRKITLFLV